MTFYEFILIVVGRTPLRSMELRSANGVSRAGQTYFKTDPMARHAACPLPTKLTSVVAIFCGSGFPAAIIEAESLSHNSLPRGWRGAP
jgi:hypothetical protein